MKQPQRGVEGEAPAALPTEGATRAPCDKHERDYCEDFRFIVVIRKLPRL